MNSHTRQYTHTHNFQELQHLTASDLTVDSHLGDMVRLFVVQENPSYKVWDFGRSENRSEIAGTGWKLKSR